MEKKVMTNTLKMEKGNFTKTWKWCGKRLWWLTKIKGNFDRKSWKFHVHCLLLRFFFKFLGMVWMVASPYCINLNQFISLMKGAKSLAASFLVEPSNGRLVRSCQMGKSFASNKRKNSGNCFCTFCFSARDTIGVIW